MTWTLTQTTWTNFSMLYFFTMLILYPLTKPYKIFDLVFVLGAGYLLITGFLNLVGGTI